MICLWKPYIYIIGDRKWTGKVLTAIRVGGTTASWALVGTATASWDKTTAVKHRQTQKRNNSGTLWGWKGGSRLEQIKTLQRGQRGEGQQVKTGRRRRRGGFFMRRMKGSVWLAVALRWRRGTQVKVHTGLNWGKRWRERTNLRLPVLKLLLAHCVSPARL